MTPQRDEQDRAKRNDDGERKWDAAHRGALDPAEVGVRLNPLMAPGQFAVGEAPEPAADEGEQRRRVGED